MSRTRTLPLAPVPRFNLRLLEHALEYYERLRKLRQYVSKHPDSAPSLAEAASIAGLSRTHFSEYFHQKTGVPFKLWLDYVRAERAAKALQSSDKTVTDVAQENGFSDGTTFCRTFRRVYGTSPSEFRSQRTPRQSVFIAAEPGSDETPEESE